MTAVRKEQPSRKPTPPIAEIVASIEAGKPVRLDLADGGRLHVDRPLPFICVHIGDKSEDLAARDVARANAAHLVSPDAARAVRIANAIGHAMRRRFGAFLVLDVAELERDALLTDDAPYLPPFEIIVSETPDAAAGRAADAFAEATEAVEARFRVPRIDRRPGAAGGGPMQQAGLDHPCLSVRFAPIYRQAGKPADYPELRERVVANIYDAGLKACSAFLAASGVEAPATHRVFGRKVFVDAVRSGDRSIDEIAAEFDFLLAVTPVNAAAARKEFESGGRAAAPVFLYRPLTVKVDEAKRRLFSIPFDHFEDPVLFDLYREKQHELDLQLTMISARNTPAFREMGRALYGSVSGGLLKRAENILDATGAAAAAENAIDPAEFLDSVAVRREARAMLERYRRANPAFDATVELRDDLPAGLMVSGSRLLISSATRLWHRRVEALLNHEIGVHLLTYFNGSAQGLRLFRSGLAGYEGVQEGLAVFAEYLVGGMTVRRLRLIAGRVVACAAMLQEADFVETYRLLKEEHGFTDADAFNLCLRVYRSGGLAKDAIYLRGLIEILQHLGNGGSLTPFWMGKIAGRHFTLMQELNARGLLRSPAVEPEFLSHPEAEARLRQARAGMSPVDMIT